MSDTVKMSINNAINALREEEGRLSAELDNVREVIRRLGESPASKVARRKSAGSAPRRQLSKQGREAISRAARKRWAAWRKAQKQAKKA